jgi:hypothetical protein
MQLQTRLDPRPTSFQLAASGWVIGGGYHSLVVVAVHQSKSNEKAFNINGVPPIRRLQRGTLLQYRRSDDAVAAWPKCEGYCPSLDP